jgi:Pentapeptide repeats (8 copies)
MRVPGAVVLTVAVVVLAAAAIFVLPEVLVPASARLTDAERYGLENSVRTTLLQAIGGALLLAGAFFTWRQVLLGQRQLDIARQGQVTERFTRAIEQLGSDTLDVRLGGIYALENLAKVAEEERGQVIEVLAAFVRVHAPRPGAPEPAPADAEEEDEGLWLPMRQRAPDVQTALQVLGRLRRSDDPVMALSDTDLRRSELRRMSLERAWITNASLQDANIRGGSLAGARLTGSDLSGLEASGVSFERAGLQGARLRRANLSGCDLRGADLQHADLTSAVLRGADLSGANVRRAVLDGADLRGVDLSQVRFRESGQTERAFTDDPAPPTETVVQALGLAEVAREWAIAALPWSVRVRELARHLDSNRRAAELALVECIGSEDALMTRRRAVRLLMGAMAASEAAREAPPPPAEGVQEHT